MKSRALSLVFAVLAVVVATATVAEARYCNSPYCSMCNRLFGVMSPVPQGIVVAPARHATQLKIESTPQVVVDAMLRELNLTPDDVLYDLGCGDGRILIAAVEQYGCKALGIEIDPRVAELAIANVRRAGCGRITIITGDARKFNLDKATAATMYLFPDLMAELLPRIATDRIVSYSHEMPGRQCRQVVVDGRHTIYVLEQDSGLDAMLVKETWPAKEPDWGM